MSCIPPSSPLRKPPDATAPPPAIAGRMYFSQARPPPPPAPPVLLSMGTSGVAGSAVAVRSGFGWLWLIVGFQATLPALGIWIDAGGCADDAGGCADLGNVFVCSTSARISSGVIGGGFGLPKSRFASGLAAPGPAGSFITAPAAVGIAGSGLDMASIKL